MNINMLTFRTSLSEGGIQNTGFLLADAFGKQKSTKLHLITDEFSDVPEGVDVIRVISKGKLNIVYYLRMRNILCISEKPDFNLCLYWKCGIPCLISKIFNGTPYAVMVHGNELMKSPHFTIKRFFYEHIRKLVLDHASCVFAVSEYTKSLCSQGCRNNNIRVIHTPVQYDDVTEDGTHKNYILFSIGRHVERKGFQDVIRAMPKLRRMYPQIRYRLAGDGPYHSELVELARELGLEECVEFLGKVSEEQKREELQKCDFFIMTSHIDEEHCEVEGFGICYLEANAYGKWVIARDSGGVSDAVLDNVTGYLLPNSDVDTICEAVDRFYKSCVPDIPELKRWAKLHCPENITEQYIKALKEYA